MQVVAHAAVPGFAVDAQPTHARDAVQAWRRSVARIVGPGAHGQLQAHVLAPHLEDVVLFLQVTVLCLEIPLEDLVAVVGLLVFGILHHVAASGFQVCMLFRKIRPLCLEHPSYLVIHPVFFSLGGER